MGRVIALTFLATALAPLHANPTHHGTAVAPKKPSTTQIAKKPGGSHSGSVAARVAPASSSTRSSFSSRPSGRVPLREVSAVRTSARTGHRSARSVRAIHIAPAPTYQLHPDPDRYVAIQKALADKGYFKGDPNGEWSDDSVDAMRRFQADLKIDDDGKIDALSLISLGLGPKHDGVSAPLPPAPVPVTTPAGVPLSTPTK